jgi:hypothetical protein
MNTQVGQLSFACGLNVSGGGRWATGISIQALIF